MGRFEDRAIYGIRILLFSFGIALFSYCLKRLPTEKTELPLAPANNGQDVTSPDHTGAEVVILTNHNNVELYARCWHAPESERRGVLTMVHGFTFHSEYFGELAHTLLPYGVSTCAVDLTGHGRSGSLYSMRGYVHTFQNWVNDADLLIRYLHQKNPGVPLYVYGESLGGAVALKLMRRLSLAEHVQGYILSGAVVRVSPTVLPPSWIMPVLHVASFLLPRWNAPGQNITAGWKEAFGDQEFAEMASSDPLIVWEPAKLGTMVSVLTATTDNWQHLENITAPLLVLHSKEDTRAEAVYAQEVYDRASSSDKTLKLYEGMRHQLLQETAENKRRVFQDITQWLEQRLQAVDKQVLEVEGEGAATAAD